MLAESKNLKNIFFLSCVQGLNYIVPLLTIPVLTATLGIEGFGMYSFLFSVSLMASFIIDFGFSVYGSKHLSKIYSRSFKTLKTENLLYCTVILIRSFFFILVSFLSLTIVYFYTKSFDGNIPIFTALSFLIFQISSIFNMDWYYQGKQKTKPLLYTALIVKVTFIFYVLFFIDERVSYGYVFLIFAFTLLLGNLFLFILSGFHKKIICRRLLRYSFAMLMHVRLFFTSKISIEIYRTLPTIILGVFTTPVNISYYVIAEKIITSIQSLQLPIGKALLPSAVEKISEIGAKRYTQNFIKILPRMIVAYFIIFVLVNIFSKNIVSFFSNEGVDNILLNLHILSLLIIVGSINYFIGMVGLIPLGMNLYYTQALVFVATVSVFWMIPAIYFHLDVGAVVSLIISELFILILFLRGILGKVK